jgi:hypothetical protein
VEFRARMAERQEDMQLAVEEQQLQKAAAVKQQESLTDDLRQKFTDLTEVSSALAFLQIVLHVHVAINCKSSFVSDVSRICCVFENRLFYCNISPIQ